MLRQANNSDLSSVITHLTKANLVLSGVEEHLEHFWLWLEGDLLGTIGLEVYGNVALLRSVAVSQQHRNLGIGRKLLQKSFEYARSLDVEQVVLLTETAKDYFIRFGFKITTRNAVPEVVTSSSEFRGACSESAAVLLLHLPRIRPAQPADAESICQIYNQGIEDRIATFETMPRTKGDILEWFTPTYPFLLAEHENNVVGFIRASSYRSRECYAGIAEYSIYVAREMQGKRIGDALMQAFLPYLKQAGFWKVLSRIFPENTASRALCERHGFREVGVYQKHAMLDSIWRDCVIVEKILE